jgi:RecA-family ATPase
MSSNINIKDYSADEFERTFGSAERILDTHGTYTDKNVVNEGLGLTWRELSEREFTNTEKILFGLLRGNVGAMFAVTNLGKTTLSLNIALTLAAGRTFHPFVRENDSRGRRVMIIDGESTLPEIKADIEKMMLGWSAGERALVQKNLFIICDEEINDEPLDLSNPQHVAAITECALNFKPDLITVDTLSALFNLSNENDNAEIKNVVMQPLKKLAKDVGAVVWLLHHVGKQNEDGQTKVGAYLGRGGSNIGALSRTVTVLKADKLDPDRVIFSVAKAKGYHQEPVLMLLDRDARWFVPTNETLPHEPNNYELVVSTVKGFGRSMKRKEIAAALKGIMSESTITRLLNEAVTRRDLHSPKYGYFAPSQEHIGAYEEAAKIM